MDKKVAGQLKKFEKEFDALVKGEKKKIDLGPLNMYILFYWEDNGLSAGYSYVSCTIKKDGGFTKAGKIFMETFLEYSQFIEDSIIWDLFDENSVFDKIKREYEKKIEDFHSRFGDFCNKHNLDSDEIYNQLNGRYSFP